MKTGTKDRKSGAKAMRGPSLGAVLGQLLPVTLLATAFAAVGIIHVTARVMVVDAGYRLSKLEQDNRALVRDNDNLKLELATLKSPGRLEKIAREQLGMAPPAQGVVVSLSKSRARSVAPSRPSLARAGAN